MDTEEATKRFYGLVWPQLPAVLRMARILTGNSFEAEDLAQAAMLKAFKAIGQFRDGTDVRAWLATILRNARIDYVRSIGAGPTHISFEDFPQELASPPVANELPDPSEGIDELLESFSDRQIIEALKGLPEEIRWTLLLLDVQGLSQDEVTGILGIPLGTVKSRAHRGRSMLRQALLPLARDRRLARE